MLYVVRVFETRLDLLNRNKGKSKVVGRSSGGRDLQVLVTSLKGKEVGVYPVRQFLFVESEGAELTPEELRKAYG